VTPSLSLGNMHRRDLKAVMVIEQEVYPEPWSQAIFNSELALRKGRAYRVAKVGRTIAGYFGLMLVEDEAHVTTIAVSPAFQRQGVATELLLDGARIALAAGCRHLSLEVAASNERAQALYRRFGFAPVGVRKGYYPITGEDAYVMWAYDINTPAYAERLAGIEAALRSPT
jgi:[ribosomal protein S18]-alanine N-acetyltransferase